VTEWTLFLNGTIAEESWFDDDVTPQLFKEELNAGNGDITVWINSPGGDCIAAAQIYNMLMEYKGNVTVKIDGIAASAASVIAMAGTKVLMSPVSMMMIHNPMTVAFGDSAEMQKAIDMLSSVKDSIINAYEIKTGFRKLGRTITTSGERKINIAATKPAAAWIDEGEELTWGDAKFAQINLDAHKLHVAVKVTEELLYDNAFGLENYIIRQFSKALANAEEDAFLNGTGTGQPLGLLATDGGAEIGVTAASATEITADEIIDLVYSLKRPYRKNAKFICNDQTLAAIRKLTDKNGRYLWQDSVQAGEPGRLLGYEVYTSPYFPVITAGMPAIAFGDYSYYNIGDRGTRSFAELKELFAGNGMVGFVAKERVDGKLVLAEAVKLLTMATV